MARLLRDAFPSALAGDVDAVIPKLPRRDWNGEDVLDRDIGPLSIGGEALRIPGRVYFPESDSIWGSGLTPEQELIADCMYSRHCDGYVREKFLRKILFAEPDWVAPFVIQLVGEYVVNIVSFIADHLEELGKPGYTRFVAENPGFLALTQARVASYWDCYHRYPYFHLADYPGTRILRFLKSLPAKE